VTALGEGRPPLPTRGIPDVRGRHHRPAEAGGRRAPVIFMAIAVTLFAAEIGFSLV
jgi:hypothetical protein